MPAMSFVDLAMFLLETRERPFNVGPLIVVDPPPRQRKSYADRLVARMLERPAGPPFNERLHTPRIGLPRLEEVPGFDPARHVHRITLNGPAPQAELFERICTLHQKPLARSRPLWDLYVFDGLEGGQVALYGKVHHGIIDGRTFVKVIANWLAATPTERTVRAMWEGVPRPTPGEAPTAPLVAQLRSALGQATGAAFTAAAVVRMLGEQTLGALGAGSGDTLMLPFTDIPKVLTGRLSTKRSFAYCMLPLAELQALGKAHGATVNDLLLTTLDIALARYLHELGTDADKPLVTAMPVALARAKGGNNFAILQFPLGAPGKSPAARLAQIRAHTATVKGVVKRETSETVMLFTTLVHGIPALLEKLGVKNRIALSNLIVSNPFGLAEKRYLMGAPVVLALPLALINAGQMLNVTAATGDDQLQVSFLAIPSAVPHVDKLTHNTSEAFEELKSALSVAASATGASRVSARATRTTRRGARGKA
jgi:diacylglycerol O-acyltransferase